MAMSLEDSGGMSASSVEVVSLEDSGGLTAFTIRVVSLDDFGGMEFLVGVEFFLEYSTYSGYEGNTLPFSIELDK
ncbi:hypothetical protein RYX36_006868, partial [Vicia faba]